ncbi:hypothetical protein ACVWXM_006256 [Bradyrhizobium sp. GM7.3]
MKQAQMRPEILTLRRCEESNITADESQPAKRSFIQP